VGAARSRHWRVKKTAGAWRTHGVQQRKHGDHIPVLHECASRIEQPAPLVAQPLAQTVDVGVENLLLLHVSQRRARSYDLGVAKALQRAAAAERPQQVLEALAFALVHCQHVLEIRHRCYLGLDLRSR
jgi:hypothetical protein